MKVTPLLLLTLGLSSIAHGQPGHWQLIINNNWGYTVVDVPAAVEIPEISGGKGLSDWNQFNYRGMAQFLYRSSETLSYGPEIGVSRLYFWEERYIPIGLSARYRWETVWTWSVGGLVRLDLTSRLLRRDRRWHPYLLQRDRQHSRHPPGDRSYHHRQSI